MFFLGIDGGGSQTRALLCDASGQVCGEGSSGSSNPRSTPEDALRHHLLQAMEQAKGGIDPSAIAAAHLGIAGASDAIARATLTRLARECLTDDATQLAIGHDLETALEGGLVGEPGIVLVAGTGSSCYGRNGDGRSARCGGWGDLVDDAGSGSWIGLRALQACVRQADGRLKASELLARVLAFLEIDSMDDFITRIHDAGLSRTDRAQLAPVVFELAAGGDAIAASIRDEATEELCRLATSVREQLWLAEAALVVQGGLTGEPTFGVALQAHLGRAGFEIRQPRLPPVAGAVLLAMRTRGLKLDDAALTRLHKHFYKSN